MATLSDLSSDSQCKARPALDEPRSVLQDGSVAIVVDRDLPDENAKTPRRVPRP